MTFNPQILLYYTTQMNASHHALGQREQMTVNMYNYDTCTHSDLNFHTTADL